MADNIAITAGSGTNIATDDIGGIHFQRVKLTAGVDGTASDLASFTDTASSRKMLAVVNPAQPLPFALLAAGNVMQTSYSAGDSLGGQKQITLDYADAYVRTAKLHTLSVQDGTGTGPDLDFVFAKNTMVAVADGDAPSPNLFSSFDETFHVVKIRSTDWITVGPTAKIAQVKPDVWIDLDANQAFYFFVTTGTSYSIDDDRKFQVTSMFTLL